MWLAHKTALAKEVRQSVSVGSGSRRPNMDLHRSYHRQCSYKVLQKVASQPNYRKPTLSQSPGHHSRAEAFVNCYGMHPTQVMSGRESEVTAGIPLRRSPSDGHKIQMISSLLCEGVTGRRNQLISEALTVNLEMLEPGSPQIRAVNAKANGTKHIPMMWRSTASGIQSVPLANLSTNKTLVVSRGGAESGVQSPREAPEKDMPAKVDPPTSGRVIDFVKLYNGSSNPKGNPLNDFKRQLFRRKQERPPGGYHGLADRSGLRGKAKDAENKATSVSMTATKTSQITFKAKSSFFQEHMLGGGYSRARLRD